MCLAQTKQELQGMKSQNSEPQQCRYLPQGQRGMDLASQSMGKTQPSEGSWKRKT